MASVLCLYASKHGHTAKIAARIAESLRAESVAADLHDVQDAPDVNATDPDAHDLDASRHAADERLGRQERRLLDHVGAVEGRRVFRSGVGRRSRPVSLEEEHTPGAVSARLGETRAPSYLSDFIYGAVDGDRHPGQNDRSCGPLRPAGRTVTTFACGTVEYPCRPFLPLDALAATAWATYTALLGFVGGGAFRDSLWRPLLLGLGVAI